MGTESDQETNALTPNRVALAAVTVASAMIGLAPYLWYAGRPLYLAILALIAGVVCLRSVRKATTEASDHPSVGEWLLAGYGQMSMFAMIGLVGFLFHLIGWLVVAGLDSLEWVGEGHRQAAGMWTALSVLTLLVVAVSASVSDDLVKWLYQRSPGARTPFFALLSNPGKMALVALGGIIAGVLLFVFFPPPATFFYVGLGLALFYTGFPLINLAERSTNVEQGLEGSLRDLMKGFGYDTAERPRSREPGVAPLIAEIDLLAWNDERIFAINIKKPSSDAAAVDWSAANGIRTASSVVRDDLPESVPQNARVEPLLLVVGGRVDDSLTQFAREQDVHLAHFQDATAFDTDLTAERRDAAANILRDAGVPVPARERQGS